MNPILDLSDVAVRLGGQPVLTGVDLVVEPGDVVEVTGPNGSGKTTLLKILATLIRPSDGAAQILGEKAGSPGVREVRSRIGFISHQPALIEELTLGENLAHFARISGVEEMRCERALDVVGLSGAADRRAGESSFGMRRRAEIAWLLVSKPHLLLLDEARSGLDIQARDLISAVVGSTVRRGGSVVTVSHEPQGLAVDDLQRNARAFQLIAGRLETVS